MTKKADRAAKAAGSTPRPALPSPAALPLPSSPLSMLATRAEQPTLPRSVDFNFAEGSSFLALPRSEQERMIGYLRAYRKELPRLLGEGEAGRFAVIKPEGVAHVWDTADDAMQAATLLLGTDRFAVYQVKPQDVDRLAGSEETKVPPCPR